MSTVSCGGGCFSFKKPSSAFLTKSENTRDWRFSRGLFLPWRGQVASQAPSPSAQSPPLPTMEYLTSRDTTSSLLLASPGCGPPGRCACPDLPKGPAILPPQKL